MVDDLVGLREEAMLLTNLELAQRIQHLQFEFSIVMGDGDFAECDAKRRSIAEQINLFTEFCTHQWPDGTSSYRAVAGTETDYKCEFCGEGMYQGARW